MVRQHRLLAVSPVAWACAVALAWTGDAVRGQAAETSIAWVTGKRFGSTAGRTGRARIGRGGRFVMP